MPESLLKFDEKGWTDNGDFEVEFKSGAIGEVQFSLDGALTSGGAGTRAQDAALKMLGQLELNQNGPRVKCDARLLYYLSAFYEGGVRNLSAASGGPFHVAFNLPLQRMIPFGGMDAIARIVSWKGRFRDGSYYDSAGLAVVNGATRIRPTAVVPELAPEGGFRDPEFTQETIKVETASVGGNTRKIEARSTFLLPGLMLMALDANGDAAAATDASGRSDGVAHRVTVELYIPGRPRRTLVDGLTWGELRRATARLAGWSDADVTATAGIVWVPLFERQGGKNADALVMPEGSHLMITIDNASGAENIYTAVTPAAGDTVEVLVPRFYERPKAAEGSAPTAVAGAAKAATRRR